MNSSETEHFVTLFDSNFLPMGMALHASLMKHAQPFRLWIVCMDELVEQQLEQISLPNVTLIPVQSIETTELLNVKPGRSRVEYCWTLTPFTFEAVFNLDKSVTRVTYLDADLFFFASPQILLKELDDSGKHVLITEHAYAPEYQRLAPVSGRFCVQFLTFRTTAPSRNVLAWWKERCLEWCFCRIEEGKFGDQKYLDSWPALFAHDIHILLQRDKTAAPWNVRHLEKTLFGKLNPVFYHFHSTRIVSPKKMLLYRDFKIGEQGLKLYSVYVDSVRNSLDTLQKSGAAIPFCKEVASIKGKIWQTLTGRRGYAKIC